MKALLNNGINDGLTLNEVKKLRLTNIFILSYYGVILASIIADYFFARDFALNLSIHAFQFCLLIFLQFLIKKGNIQIAKVVLTFWLMTSCFIFANFAEPNQFMEFFYLLGVCFSMMIIDSKVIQRVVLVTAICLMVFPILYFDYYTEPVQMSPTLMPVSMCWVLFYLVVVYFKTNNTRNEKELLKQKKLVDEQKRKLEELNNFQKQFFVNVAHEIRTPITLIKGHANRLSSNENSHVIIEQTDKIQHIVDDVLDLAKLETDSFKLNTKEFNLTLLLQKVTTSFDTSFLEKNIKLSFDNSVNANVVILADSIFLERAINNIISNALKYTPENGFVKVSLSVKGETVFVKIKDSGIGVKKEDYENIFERFFQADNSINKSGGSGIGLAFTKEIIHLHNGSINVISEEGIGSEFCIEIPLLKLESETNQPEFSAELGVDKRLDKDDSHKTKKSVLLVEDNLDMRKFIKSMLLDYKVVEAHDGKQGLEQLTKQDFSFIITDYMMPNMNGYDFVKQLRALKYDTPVLMLTAKDDEETKIESFRIGIDDFMGKPFNEEELLIRVRNNIKNNESRKAFIQEEHVDSEEIEIPFLTKVTNYIYENCHEQNFGVDQLCEEFALSTSSLYRKLKSLTGLSSKAIITEVRLKKAHEIISKNRDYNIIELAESVGYTNYTHFKKLYNERYAGANLS